MPSLCVAALGRAAEFGRPPHLPIEASPRGNMPTMKQGIDSVPAGDRSHARSTAGRHERHGGDSRGRREIAREIRPCDKRVPRGRARADARAVDHTRLEPSTRARPWVRVVFPRRAFFKRAADHRLQPPAYPPELLPRGVQATNIRAEDRIVELIKLDLDNRSLACVAASPAR